MRCIKRWFKHSKSSIYLKTWMKNLVNDLLQIHSLNNLSYKWWHEWTCWWQTWWWINMNQYEKKKKFIKSIWYTVHIKIWKRWTRYIWKSLIFKRKIIKELKIICNILWLRCDINLLKFFNSFLTDVKSNKHQDVDCKLLSMFNELVNFSMMIITEQLQKNKNRKT